MREVLRGRVHRHGRRIVGVECALRAPEPVQPRGLGVVEVRGDVQALQVARAVAHGVPLSLRLPVLFKGMTFLSHMGRLIHSPVDEYARSAGTGHRRRYAREIQMGRLGELRP